MQAAGRRGVDAAAESPADRLQRACRAIAIAALKDSRMNLSCFRQARDAAYGAGSSAVASSTASGRSARSAASMRSASSSGA